MGNSYVFTDNGCVVAYFTIFNDALRDLGDKRNIFNRKHKIPNRKRRNAYPAIKIGRLGVHQQYQGSGLAYELMDFIKGWVILDHKPAVKFLTLDAYNKPQQIDYYKRNGFELLPIPNNPKPNNFNSSLNSFPRIRKIFRKSNEDKGILQETVPMYFPIFMLKDS